LIKSQQLGEKIVVAGREHSFGQSYGCVLAGLLARSASAISSYTPVFEGSIVCDSMAAGQGLWRSAPNEEKPMPTAGNPPPR
jgi:hypothetical protein